MAKEIRWTSKALLEYENVLDYLASNWTQKEVDKFILKTKEITLIISQNPLLFRSHSNKNLREVLITKHNLLIYKVIDSTIYIVSIWDTRKNPREKPIK